MDSNPEISTNPAFHIASSRLDDNQLSGARQRLETALARYSGVLNGTTVGHVTLDGSDIIVEATPEAAQLAGTTLQKLLGQRMDQLVRAHDRDQLRAYLNTIRSATFDEPFTVELVRPTGGTIHTAIIGVAERKAEQKVPLVHATLIDVSNQQKVEEDLRMVRDQIERHEQSERELGWYQDKLRSVTSQLTLTEERERRRIATILHDRISQNLVSANMLLGVLLDARLSQEQSMQIGDVRRSIIEVIRNTRDLVDELSPPVLHEQPLETALEWMAEHFSRIYGLQVVLACSADDSSLPQDGRVVLFRGAQELLTNCYRHSAAKDARMVLFREGRHLCVTVEDSGAGFDPEKREDHRGIGLFLLRERLQSLGGTMEIVSRPGAGTRVTIGVPAAHARRRSRSADRDGAQDAKTKKSGEKTDSAQPEGRQGRKTPEADTT